MALFSTNHTLTQGSLHYRLATLGYQKQNPYGVRQFYKKTLRPLSLLKWLSKAEGEGVRLLHKSCKHPLLASPLSLERGWG